MVRTLWRKLVNWIDDALVLPGDTDNVRVRKITIGLIALAIIPSNLLWAFSFWRLGLGTATDINIVLGAVNILGAIFLFRTGRIRAYLNILFAATMSFFIAAQILLGGFINAGLIINAGLLIPLIGTLLLSRPNTVLWALAYLIIFTLMLAFDETFAADAPDLPASFGLVNGFFGNLTLTTFSVGMVLYLIRELEKAQNQADALLYNLLPRPIAAKLKREPGTIAQSYESASILFADIVGFTPLSAKLSPVAMIDLLNEIYSHFDSLVEKYGVEKIRTIGDNYMAAAGIPTPRPDHAQALAGMALDMLAFCQTLPPVSGRKVQFRIGINSGSLVAGVIGRKKPHYDIWGDAVNTASRMESHGRPGAVQVSAATRALLGDGFTLESRGTIEIKGKGEMETWFVVGRAAV